MEHHGQITSATGDEYKPVSGWCYACHGDKCNPCLERPIYTGIVKKEENILIFGAGI